MCTALFIMQVFIFLKHMAQAFFHFEYKVNLADAEYFPVHFPLAFYIY